LPVNSCLRKQSEGKTKDYLYENIDHMAECYQKLSILLLLKDKTCL